MEAGTEVIWGLLIPTIATPEHVNIIMQVFVTSRFLFYLSD